MENFSVAHEKVGSIQYGDGQTFRLTLDKDKSGKYKLYFLSGKQTIPSDSSAVLENNLPFISFKNNSPHIQGVRIVGMYVPPDLRSTGFSDVMLSRFFQLLERAEFGLGPTAQIKKPLLAAKLSRIGFIPERADMIARIIGTDKQNLPIVVIEENSRGVGITPKNISAKKRNTFYHVVSTSHNTQEGKRVAIQTQYLPPGSQAIREYIDDFSHKIEGKVRFYPARVKKLLEQ